MCFVYLLMMEAQVVIKRAFDEFKIRWIPPVPLVYPQPAGFFFLGVFADEKKNQMPAD